MGTEWNRSLPRGKIGSWKVVGLAVSILAGLTHPGLAQITINGVTDRSTYVDTVTFTVVPQAGYTDSATLNGAPVPVGVSYPIRRADYYDLMVTRQNDSNPTEVTQRLVRFVVRTSERGGAENGIPPWTPYAAINSASDEFSGAHLRVIVPQNYPLGLDIPVVAWVVDDDGHAVRVNGWLDAPNQPSIHLRRGVGSGFLPPATSPGPLTYSTRIAGLQTNKTIEIEANTTWTSVSGTLSGAIEWPENSRIAITGHVIVNSNATLTVGAGTVVRVGVGIDLTNHGRVTINGTIERPVVFTPADRSQPWGGFTMRNGLGQVVGSGAIFTGSGAVQNWFGSAGNPGSHRKEQGLFFCAGTNVVSLTDSAAIRLAGQLGHAVNGGTFTFDRFLMQGVTSGGEYSGGSAPLTFRVNDSAFIDCPDDTANYVDGDNDALYLVHGDHGFTNTLFGWTKDDGIDSGGSGAARLNYERCWFESIFHEGNSLSGNQTATAHADKDVYHHHGVFLGCGQAVEVGYGAPTGRIDHCLVIGGMTGTRFGDNYDWEYYGFLQTTNSILIHNHRDVWGVNFQDWTYRTSAMAVGNNWFTSPNTNHPDNFVWDPAGDADALADFLTIPPDSRVGVGFATRTAQFPIDEVTNPIPVGLSTFTPQPVTVDYTVESLTEILESGTLTFAPGEIIQSIQPSPAAVLGHDPVRVVLRNAVQGELTGPSQVLFLKTPPPPVNTTFIAAGSNWQYNDLGGDQGTAWRSPTFDDRSWSNGVAQLGFSNGEEDDEATFIRPVGTNGQRSITFYFRQTFVVETLGSFSHLALWLLRDDGGVVYLNGSEAFRSPNVPEGPVNYLTTTESPNGENTVDTADLSPELLRLGTNVVAVEIHQQSAGSSDVSFDLSLAGVPSTLPRIDLIRFSDGWVLSWTDETALLESAETADGAWSPVPRARTPFALQPEESQKFYRLRRP